MDDRELQTIIEHWLMNHGVTRKEYLRRIVNRRAIPDGLFVWLACWAKHQHLNIVHSNGVWSSRKSEITVLTDATIMLIVNCFLLSLAMQWCNAMKEDPLYIQPLCDPCETQSCYVIMPKILNRPVHDVNDCLQEIGMYATGPRMLIQDNLALLQQCTTVDF